MLVCCCGQPACQCLRHQAGAFQLDPHVRFDGNAFGIHVGATRQTDLTLWKGYAGSTPGPSKSTAINIRIPTSGKPRLLVLIDEPHSLTAADFDALGSRQGCLFECTNNTLIDLRSVTAGQTVTINGVTFAAHATTTTIASREFSIAGTNTQDAAELATCINDPTYGVPGVTATAIGSTYLGRVHLLPSKPATTTASTITIRNETWNLLESNDFAYLGESVTASLAAVDGIAMVPIFSGFSSFVHPPDAVWCNPSYIPDTVQVIFANWQNQNLGAPGELRRANFNGVPMAIPLTGTIILGSRTFRNYGDSFGPAYYSDPTITCAGFPAWPKDTLRWRLRAQTNTATVPDGTASQTWVLITEDQVNAADSHGCHSSFSADLGAPRYTGFFKYLSTFDRLDDGPPAITHWIKKGDTSASNSIPDGVPYWTHTFNFSSSAPALGDLLRVFP